MFSHAPADYRCPLCDVIAGQRIEFEWQGTAVSIGPELTVREYPDVVVAVNPMWRPANPGSVLVLPRAHHENVFDFPAELALPAQIAVQESAVAMKEAYECDGISVHQHNEPAGNQDVWHYHVHVVPRYANDGLYATTPAWAPKDAVVEHVERLSAAYP